MLPPQGLKKHEQITSGRRRRDSEHVHVWLGFRMFPAEHELVIHCKHFTKRIKQLYHSPVSWSRSLGRCLILTWEKRISCVEPQGGQKAVPCQRDSARAPTQPKYIRKTTCRWQCHTSVECGVGCCHVCSVKVSLLRGEWALKNAIFPFSAAGGIPKITSGER